MAAVITIGGADKSGALARITTYFARKGYGLRGHQFAEAPSGLKLLKMRLDATELNKEELAAELKGLHPEYILLNVSLEDAGASDSTRRAGLIKQMANGFPDVADLVRTYGESFAPRERDRELYEAGRKIGAFHYAKEWAFGSPLKMPTAIRRTLVPALEKFANVEATDMELSLSASAFCGPGMADSRCEFVTGFIQGFLDAGPSTKNSRVHKYACSATGDGHCAYRVDYEA
jgi:predicted hydrocarbon binding protein